MTRICELLCCNYKSEFSEWKTKQNKKTNLCRSDGEIKTAKGQSSAQCTELNRIPVAQTWSAWSSKQTGKGMHLRPTLYLSMWHIKHQRRAIDFCVSWEMVISGKKKVVFRKDIFSAQVFARKVMADWSLLRRRRGWASLEFFEFLVYSDGSVYTTMPVCKSGTWFRWREVHLSSTSIHREAFLFSGFEEVNLL